MIKIYTWYNTKEMIWETGEKDALNHRRIRENIICTNVESRFFKTKRQLKEFEQTVENKNK